MSRGLKSLCIVLVATLAGCSIVGRFSDPVPDWRPPDEKLDCEPTLITAVMDTTLATTLFVVGAYSFWKEQQPLYEQQSEKEGMYGMIAIASASIGAAFALSAVYGYSANARCRRVNAGPPSWR